MKLKIGENNYIIENLESFIFDSCIEITYNGKICKERKNRCVIKNQKNLDILFSDPKKLYCIVG